MASSIVFAHHLRIRSLQSVFGRLGFRGLCMAAASTAGAFKPEDVGDHARFFGLLLPVSARTSPAIGSALACAVLLGVSLYLPLVNPVTAG